MVDYSTGEEKGGVGRGKAASRVALENCDCNCDLQVAATEKRSSRSCARGAADSNSSFYLQFRVYSNRFRKPLPQLQRRNHRCRTSSAESQLASSPKADGKCAGGLRRGSTEPR